MREVCMRFGWPNLFDILMFMVDVHFPFDYEICACVSRIFELPCTLNSLLFFKTQMCSYMCFLSVRCSAFVFVVY